ncbi:uncharacterized protein LY79DRAFT_159246 [Colletotrichum navitas]|uniref:Uncharacterized protein n=1 Tax=Colletotrichum navitas TaxID=681940 RepID=A0AAD8PJ78_9PEZI|nr:uncharacterized protein LY79DRAFT_159246 [Colletotrichum navitas]KAK1564139.1 hypothetical protein LY79DRAFT_159246 [Colletotrichum navitas]
MSGPWTYNTQTHTLTLTHPYAAAHTPPARARIQSQSHSHPHVCVAAPCMFPRCVVAPTGFKVSHHVSEASGAWQAFPSPLLHPVPPSSSTSSAPRRPSPPPLTRRQAFRTQSPTSRWWPLARRKGATSDPFLTRRDRLLALTPAWRVTSFVVRRHTWLVLSLTSTVPNLINTK